MIRGMKSRGTGIVLSSAETTYYFRVAAASSSRLDKIQATELWFRLNKQAMVKNISLDLQDLHACQTVGFHLETRKNHLSESEFYIVSYDENVAYPINDTAALVWECCRQPTRLADLFKCIAEGYPEAPGIESDVSNILNQYRNLGLVNFIQDPFECDKETNVNQTTSRTKAQELCHELLGSLPFVSRQVLWGLRGDLQGWNGAHLSSTA